MNYSEAQDAAITQLLGGIAAHDAECPPLEAQNGASALRAACFKALSQIQEGQIENQLLMALAHSAIICSANARLKSAERDTDVNNLMRRAGIRVEE